VPNPIFPQSLMVITSPKNPLLQAVRRAVSRGAPDDEGWVVAEGPHLLDEALHGTWPIHRIVATQSACQKWAAPIGQSKAPISVVDDHAFAAAASTETAQGILLLLFPRVFQWPDLLAGTGPVVVLDELQDPGNAGAIIRSAEAFGAGGVVLTKGSVQIANSKLIRAAAGSLFRLPVLDAVPVSTALSEFDAARFAIYGLAAGAHQSIGAVDWRDPCAVFVGNEGAGLSAPVLGAARLLRIPTRGVESLNAAIACSIALFEASRQRGLA
jgi:RNA methyltransferase, TrmH family